MSAPSNLPIARERIVLALRSQDQINKGTLPHVLQIPFLRNVEDHYFTYFGFDLLLNEILSNHRNSEVVIYAFNHGSGPLNFNVIQLDGRVSALRLAGIPVLLAVVATWDDLLSEETPFANVA